RARRMRCIDCNGSWEIRADSILRWAQGEENCPHCGKDFISESRFEYASNLEERTHIDELTRSVVWYHTTTYENWPDPDYDPAATMTDVSKQRMETLAGPGRFYRWVRLQRTKALHVGTYEAAVENMFGRIGDQDSAGQQFYLYRVRLKNECKIFPGV